MTQPSLMQIVQNCPVIDEDRDCLTGAQDLVLHWISLDIDEHSPLIAHLVAYTNLVVTQNDIIKIERDYEKGQYNIVYNQIIPDFKDTALYKRLEALKLMHITLRDICKDANIVREEIIEAVIRGFKDDILRYNMDGVASYPNYCIKLYPLPMYEMNIRSILDLKGKTDIVKLKNQQIQNSVKEELSLSVLNTIHAVLEYLSRLLQKCKKTDELEYKLVWINKYVVDNIDNKFWEKLDLKALLQFVPNKDINKSKSSNFRTLYEKYGENIYKIKPIEERIFQLKQFIVCNLKLEEIIQDFTILQKHDLVLNVLRLPYLYQFKKIGFLEAVYYCGKETFERFLNKVTENELYQAFQVYYDHKKGIPMLIHIITNKDTKLMLNWIVEKCVIEALINIANIEIINEHYNLISLCEFLNDPTFAQIVLHRLEENNLLNRIDNLRAYKFVASNNTLSEKFPLPPMLSSIDDFQEGDREINKMGKLSFNDTNFFDTID